MTLAQTLPPDDAFVRRARRPGHRLSRYRLSSQVGVLVDTGMRSALGATHRHENRGSDGKPDKLPADKRAGKYGHFFHPPGWLTAATITLFAGDLQREQSMGIIHGCEWLPAGGSMPAGWPTSRSSGPVCGARDMLLRMTLEQLRIFVAVAERQHVTRAAEALNLTQSAVSAAIAALEGRHGAKLFSRVGRGIELTDVGKSFLNEARAVLSRVQAAELVLSEASGLKTGTLAVQASQTIASFWLPRHLVAFRRAYPGIDVRLSVGNTAQVVAAVRAGTAELGFVEGDVTDPTLVSRPVARDQMVVVVGAGHPWAGRKSLKATDVADAEWVLREQGSGTRSVFEQALAGLGVAVASLRVVMELPSNEAVRAAVEAGMGATALSASVAAPSIEAGLLLQVPIDLPDRHFYELRHAERYHSRAAQALIDAITAR